MGNGQPQLSFVDKAELVEKTGLPSTVVQGLHKRFFWIGRGKSGKALVKHGADCFDGDPIINQFFSHGGFGKNSGDIDFQHFVEVFNRFSKHQTGHNKSLKERVGWIWDFMIHASHPELKGKIKNKRFLKAPGLLKLLQIFHPDGNHTLESAADVIHEVVDESADMIDRTSFIEYIGGCIPDCNEYMEIDYATAYGLTQDEIQAEDQLFEAETKAGLGDTADNDKPKKSETVVLGDNDDLDNVDL